MNHSLQYSALSRLLGLNNRVHDLERQLLREPIALAPEENLEGADAAAPNQFAAMQEEIDQGVRAGLVTCWLGMPDEPDI